MEDHIDILMNNHSILDLNYLEALGWSLPIGYISQASKSNSILSSKLNAMIENLPSKYLARFISLEAQGWIGFT